MNNYVGAVFLNRFRVDTLLSAGASGTLYRGWDLKRNLPLSIKVYDSPVPYDPNALCFQQDEGTLQTMMHPNITPFYGLFEDQGVSFLIEKNIDGLVLAQILQQRIGRPFPTQEALIYMKAIAMALEYAHGFGLIHCNVNPFNIIVGRDGSIQLTNFGFARHADRPMSSKGLLGLPAYYAPEQLQGLSVSPATDVYAVGMLVFELLTSRHPFLGISTSQASADSSTTERLRSAHLTQTPPDMRQFNPNLPSGFNEALVIALEKDPKLRYQSAQEMLEILCAVCGTLPQEIPDRIGGALSSPTGTQVQTHIIPGSSQRVEESAPQYVQPIPGTTPAYYQSPSSPYQAAVQGPGGTQILPDKPWQGTQPVDTPPPPPSMPVDIMESKKPRHPGWFWLLIGGGVFGIIFCGVLLVVGLPILKDYLATQTPTATLTFTATNLPPTDITLPPGILPSATLAQADLPSETLLPTEPPIPTETPIPTEPPATPTNPAQSSFTVTIRNNMAYPIYPYRDGKSMGDPIPPGKYVYYLHIKPGPHVFAFCTNPSQAKCVEKRVTVDQDMTISIP